MSQKKNLIYITETSLPTKSANIINSLKFCDALSKFYNVEMYIPNISLKSNTVKKIYSLRNEIEFNNIIKCNIHNFIYRFIFCFIVMIKLNFKKNKIILGRSILTSLFLTLFNIKNTLELHHEPKSFSKLLFKIILFLPQRKKLNLILINRSLIKILKIENLKHIVLDDGADIFNYKLKKSFDQKRNSCVYIGSFYEGKGIEIIYELSKLMPKVEFHLYGDIKTLKNKVKYLKNNNIKFFKYVDYNQIPNLLRNYKIALMPYQNIINARSNNLEISKYISPLKMFDYLASGNIIIASRLSVYNHILKNNLNSYLVSNKNLNDWKIMIKKVLNKSYNFSSMKINAINTAKKYSWDCRAEKYYNFVKN